MQYKPLKVNNHYHLSTSREHLKKNWQKCANTRLLHLKDFSFLLFQDVLGGGACSSTRTAQAKGGPVQENGGGGQRRANAPGALPARRHQASLHAVEGDHELHQHPGLPDRRDQGKGSDAKKRWLMKDDFSY